MNIADAIAVLDKHVPNPSAGLPDEIFYYISRTTPLVNVDLLIKDERGRTLLSWRDDRYTGKGWHLPGGIIRFKETMRKRLEKVVATEIGAQIKFETKPVAVNEIILKHRIRGHFISFLYRCHLSSTFIPVNKDLKRTDSGYLLWHESCPDDLLKVHKIYREYL